MALSRLTFAIGLARGDFFAACLAPTNRWHSLKRHQDRIGQIFSTNSHNEGTFRFCVSDPA